MKYLIPILLFGMFFLSTPAEANQHSLLASSFVYDIDSFDQNPDLLKEVPKKASDFDVESFSNADVIQDVSIPVEQIPKEINSNPFLSFFSFTKGCCESDVCTHACTGCHECRYDVCEPVCVDECVCCYCEEEGFGTTGGGGGITGGGAGVGAIGTSIGTGIGGVGTTGTGDTGTDTGTDTGDTTTTTTTTTTDGVIIPEPSTYLILGTCLAIALYLSKKRREAKSQNTSK